MVGKTVYVFALANYQDEDSNDYTVIYLAPKKYWEAVGDLQGYKEANEGELQRTLCYTCGDDLASWDVVHWYSTKDEDAEDLEELLETIGMEKSESLKEYADKEIQQFGDQYIAELY